MTVATLIIIANLFVLESLLSVDNAAVLAVMVKDLPDSQKKKALRYGLAGAYIFRGLCLLISSYLVSMWGLKILGGLYLVYLTYGHFTSSNDTIEYALPTGNSKIFQFASKVGLTPFWATVVLVEIMDLAFSIDNVFAAVALSPNFYVIMTGVAIGMLAMRVVAGWFVTLIEKYPSLNDSAFIVIGILGLKLILGGSADGFPEYLITVKTLLDLHTFDLVFSAVMMLIFFIPLLISHRQPMLSKV